MNQIEDLCDYRRGVTPLYYYLVPLIGHFLDYDFIKFDVPEYLHIEWHID
jgi:hypothetical protein